MEAYHKYHIKDELRKVKFTSTYNSLRYSILPKKNQGYSYLLLRMLTFQKAALHKAHLMLIKSSLYNKASSSHPQARNEQKTYKNKQCSELCESFSLNFTHSDS